MLLTTLRGKGAVNIEVLSLDSATVQSFLSRASF